MHGIIYNDSKQTPAAAAAAAAATTMNHRSFATSPTTAAAAAASSSSSSSSPSPSPSSEELQRQKWGSYLATGRGSKDLFGSMDYDQDGKLSPTDVRNFLLNNMEHAQNVVQNALRLLDKRRSSSSSSAGGAGADAAADDDDHPLDFVEFQEWLVASTQDIVQACAVQEYYESSPHVGDRRSTTLGKQQQQEPSSSSKEKMTKDKDLHLEYSWNASTMSQALRRMQYAVRGEVVMAAEKMAAAGREIIYTNIGNPQGMCVRAYKRNVTLCVSVRVVKEAKRGCCIEFFFPCFECLFWSFLFLFFGNYILSLMYLFISPIDCVVIKN